MAFGGGEVEVRYEYLSEYERWRILMAAIDDLTAKVSEVLAEQAAVDKAVTDLVQAISGSASANDPAIEAAVAQLETLRTSQVADAAQDPAVAPTPTPTPTPAPAPTPEPAPAPAPASDVEPPLV